ncbi:MAG: hypothetical protein Q9212_003561 [Teloschistes hypoglaucus]
MATPPDISYSSSIPSTPTIPSASTLSSATTLPSTGLVRIPSTTAVPSTFPNANSPHTSVSAEVIVTIAFGVVMFIIALLTLWQSRRKRFHTGDIESQPSQVPDPHNPTQSVQVSRQESAPRHVLNSHTYFNVFLSRAPDPERSASVPLPWTEEPIAILDTPPRLPLRPAPIHLNHDKHITDRPATNTGQLLELPRLR